MPNPFPIIGVGASAGGLEAFTKLVEQLPATFPGTIVFVPHLSPDHASDLVEILARKAKLPVQSVAAGVIPQSRHIYVMPPNADVTLENGAFALHPRAAGRAVRHLPIDSFLKSLAEDRSSHAVGVILSGTGADGTEGLSAVKRAGGVTFVQCGDSAKFGEMPHAASIATGGVDFVLPPAEIATQLIHICTNPALLSPPTDEGVRFDDDAMAELFTLLKRDSGTDFSCYKSGTVGRRIGRRMALLRMSSPSDYLELLRTSADERTLLFHDLLINVTSFFRDPGAFRALEAIVFPALLKDRSSVNPVRIWVPGCASGEEAYSLAIALMDFLDTHVGPRDFQIFGTDISTPAIAGARTAVFKESSLHELSRDQLQRYFVKVEGGYQVGKAVRDHIIFAVQNVISDPPFSNLDLISCRNVLIYFNPILQSRVLAMFHYSLKPTGFLLLGTSETPGERSDLYTCVDGAAKLFARRAAPPHQYADILIEQYYAKGGLKSRGDGHGGTLDNETYVIKQTDKLLLEQFAPVGFLVSETLRIVQFRGDTSRFLSPTPGSSNLNVMDMIRSDLRFDIRACVAEALDTGATAARDIFLEMDGRLHRYGLKVQPVTGPSVDGRYALVILEPAAASARGTGAAPRRGLLGRLAALAGVPPQVADQAAPDHGALREQYRRAIAERDATNEDLRLSNEELLSANEELQSTSEELETAKEELQSSNEELHTVNDEVNTRNQELRVAHDTLANLLASSQIPVVMIDAARKIRQLTPAATALWPITPREIGRPLAEVEAVTTEVDLDALAKGVIATAQTCERQVRDRRGERYNLRISPFLTGEKKVDGAVLSFSSVDALITELEKKALVLAERIVSTVREPLLVLDQSLRVQMANQSFVTLFQTEEAELIGRYVYELGDRQWDIPELRRVLAGVLEDGTAFENFEVRHDFPHIGPKVMLLNAREVQDGGGPKSGLILLAFEDMTERRKAERTFKLILDASQVGMLQAKKSGEIVYVNPEVERIFGYSAAELIGQNLSILIPARLREQHVTHMEQYWLNPMARPMGTRNNQVGLAKNGAEVPLEVSLVPMDVGGEPHILQGIFDVSFRQAALMDQHARRAAELASKAKSKFLANMSHEIRTPLSAIVGFSELVEQDPAQAVEFGRIIRRNAKHLTALIDDILDLSKVEAGQISLESVAVGLRDEVDGVVSMLSSKAKEKGLAIACTYDAQLPPSICVDAMRLRQVLLNIIGNAIKFTDSGGIDINVLGEAGPGGRAGRLVFRITDTGCGVEPQKQRQIFAPFCQEGAATARKYGGTGLGLTLSRELARLMGGDVVLTKSTLGKGSTFEVSVALQSATAAPGSIASALSRTSASGDSGAKALQGLRVLLVEDGPDNRLLFERMLKSNGAEVELAEDGAEGVKMALNQPHDVILMDVQMPVVDGRAAAEQLRQKGCGDPIVALTAHATKEEKGKCIAVGMNEYCTKPISIDELCRVVAKWAEQGSNRRSERV